MREYTNSPVDPLLHEVLALLWQRDLPRALQAALVRLMETAGAEAGTLYLALRPPREVSLGPLGEEALQTIARWREALQSESYRSAGHEARTAQAVLPNGQGLVKLPLQLPGKVIGHVALLLPLGARLSESQFERLHLLCQLSGSLSILLQELTMTQQRLERLGLLYDVGQSLASTLDLQQLLMDTIRLASDVMNAQAATLMLLDRNNPDYLIFQLAHGTKQEQLQRFRMPITQGIAGWVARNREPVISNEPNKDPRFNQRIDLNTGFLTRNILCVPMQIKGVVIGVLQVLNKMGERGFDNEDMELLLTLASQAAVAVENARLYRNLREEQERIVNAQEEVRKELARSLHDGTIQQLAAMGMLLEHTKNLLRKEKKEEALRELNELSEINSRAIRDSRTLLFELRPVILETQGLGPALRTYVERLNKEHGYTTPVRLELPGEMPELSAHAARLLFAIVQEAVGNARKHAQAEEIEVSIQQASSFLLLTISDDGRGFDPSQVQEQYATSGSLGMINMQERAEMINAEWRLHSAPGEGTRVTIRVPLLDQPVDPL